MVIFTQYPLNGWYQWMEESTNKEKIPGSVRLSSCASWGLVENFCGSGLALGQHISPKFITISCLTGYSKYNKPTHFILPLALPNFIYITECISVLLLELCFQLLYLLNISFFGRKGIQQDLCPIGFFCQIVCSVNLELKIWSGTSIILKR